MRIYLGADHSVDEVKRQITTHLETRGYNVVDCGAAAENADFYPAFCLLTAGQVVGDLGSLGIVLGREGNEEQIAANKVLGARCALGWSVQAAQFARAHYDAQLISIGTQIHSADEVLAIVDAFVGAVWSVDEADYKRIDILTQYEINRQEAHTQRILAGVRASEAGVS
ncbi:RpiB/LacA/LacB family sugar-phosphate isomerase [Mycolicibacterium novocastrense]|uniref:RpiB/LacA/LacB family sugar-phosphate isomerase n=1 Tax=Mycolicibacterium novocastrense TaxID=59813 RepID=UPI0009EC0FC1|nr:RpiB/LacA/LacB family sugar-phosphate isomerase [Mycolicibacterium novocastrense]